MQRVIQAGNEQMTSAAAAEDLPAALEVPFYGTPPLCEVYRRPVSSEGRALLCPAGSNRTFDILDSEGDALVCASGLISEDRTAIVIEKTAEAGVLLAYFFLKGGRRVNVSLGQTWHSGRLSMRWDRGRRVWQISLAEAITHKRIEDAEPYRPEAGQ